MGLFDYEFATGQQYHQPVQYTNDTILIPVVVDGQEVSMAPEDMSDQQLVSLLWDAGQPYEDKGDESEEKGRNLLGDGVNHRSDIYRYAYYWMTEVSRERRVFLVKTTYG